MNNLIKQIEPKEAIDRLSYALFIDVREPKEAEKGKISDALIIPKDLIEYYAHINNNKILGINFDKEIILYCTVGVRSQLAAETLVGLGFKKVFNLIGGINKWIAIGGLIEND